jgi:hypothetical protein
MPLVARSSNREPETGQGEDGNNVDAFKERDLSV